MTCVFSLRVNKQFVNYPSINLSLNDTSWLVNPRHNTKAGDALLA